MRPLCTVSQPSESFLPLRGHKAPHDYWRRRIVGGGRKKPLTQFVHRGGEWLAGFDNGVIALDSVGPTGACVGEPACGHCRRGATEGNGDFFFLINFHNLSKSTKFQPSEDSAYLTLQRSKRSRDHTGQLALHHDQYPFPAASDYRALHILSGCFSSL